MSIMIRDPAILALLDELSERTGTTKAEVLRDALKRELESGQDRSTPADVHFPRDRISFRTYSI